MLIDIHDIPNMNPCTPNLDDWKCQLAECIAKTAKLREESYEKSPGSEHERGFQGYRMSLEVAAMKACEGSAMVDVVIKQLKRSWNDALDFAKEHGFDG